MGLYIVGLLLSYMFLNVFTDLKYRKTKNMWHLLFLILGIGITYFAGIRTGKRDCNCTNYGLSMWLIVRDI